MESNKFYEDFLKVFKGFVEWLDKERDIEFRKCVEEEHPQCVDDVITMFNEYTTELGKSMHIYNMLFLNKDE